MPTHSPKQHRFMEAAAHDKGFARRAGISQGVAREFVEADEHRERERGEREFRGGASRIPMKGYGR